ncbi:hypothetical protein FAUST_10312 [Fusarium austroamericanum]|uniref:Uncharacterized protein n=1 Tax=Fusarium austroamericanum TaxID=282268 RepID=A0AAN6BVU1_FUSAU|nr:hypothetical protein FAUST_10312 [Fusarium austroamericanum]
MDTTQSNDTPLVENIQYFDEASAYNENHPEDPARSVGSGKVNLPLLVEEVPDGQLRAKFEGDSNVRRVLSKDESDYCLTVDRLVWIDGWHSTFGSGDDKKRKQEMTLLVLNLTFENKRRENKIGSAIAELTFLSDTPEGQNPEVTAWGPFRRVTCWNPSTAQSTISVKGSLEASAGFAGQQVSAFVGREKEISKEIVDFDQGSSAHFYSAPRGKRQPGEKPNGVRWMIKQNNLQRQGIDPELRIAVLVSRPESMAPYRVSFRLEANTGTKESFRNTAQRYSGRPIGDQVNWRTSPGDVKMSYGGGIHIAKLVDRENLGTLIKDPGDGENLDQPWLQPWRRVDLSQLAQACRSGAESTYEAESMMHGVEEAAGAVTFGEAEVDVHIEQHSVHAVGDESDKPKKRPGPMPSVGVSGEPEAAAAAVTGGGRKGASTSTSGNRRHASPEPRLWESITCDCQLGRRGYREYDRLLWLETRTAQAEARLASQDQVIFDLQKAVTVLQQTVSGGGYQT